MTVLSRLKLTSHAGFLFFERRVAYEVHKAASRLFQDVPRTKSYTLVEEFEFGYLSRLRTTVGAEDHLEPLLACYRRQGNEKPSGRPQSQIGVNRGLETIDIFHALW